MRKPIISLIIALAIGLASAQNQPNENISSYSEVITNINNLNSVYGEIDALYDKLDQIDDDIEAIDTDLNEIDKEMGHITDSMIVLRLKSVDYLRKARKVRKCSPEIDLLSGRNNIYSSMRRNGYVNSDIFQMRFKLRELNNKFFSLQNEREHIKELIDNETVLYAMRDEIDALIDKREDRASYIVKQLLHQREEAEKALDDQQKSRDFLDRTIAARIKVENDDQKKQTSKTEEKKAFTPSDFASQRGQLIFPVSGKFNIVNPFGSHEHEALPGITVDNPGIDIEVKAGSKARAVYDGKVSGVYTIGSYNYVVMVRHGDFITVYANLQRANVKKGDKVSTGQTLGTIQSDKNDNDRTILHFEVRKGTEKLNPLDWVKS